MAADMGFTRMLLTGHIGKLIKVAGGIMNTHSREADCRIELLTAFAFKCGVAPRICKFYERICRNKRVCKKQRGIYPGIHRKEIMCFHKNRRYFIFRGSAKQGVCLYVK